LYKQNPLLIKLLVFGTDFNYKEVLWCFGEVHLVCFLAFFSESSVIGAVFGSRVSGTELSKHGFLILLGAVGSTGAHIM